MIRPALFLAAVIATVVMAGLCLLVIAIGHSRRPPVPNAEYRRLLESDEGVQPAEAPHYWMWVAGDQRVAKPGTVAPSVTWDIPGGWQF